MSMLARLSEAPDSQIDIAITERMKAIVAEGREATADEMIDILDDCAFGALASGFAMQAMDMYWRDLGGTQQQAERRRHERSKG